jgi:hypothetical protein
LLPRVILLALPPCCFFKKLSERKRESCYSSSWLLSLKVWMTWMK